MRHPVPGTRPSRQALPGGSWTTYAGTEMTAADTGRSHITRMSLVRPASDLNYKAKLTIAAAG
jgi:hypothetical protein